MAFDTYANLQVELLSLLNRTDTDASTRAPSWITLAESQMHRRFLAAYRKGLSYPRRIMQRSDASLSDGDEFIAVPDDFASPIDFTLTSAVPEIVLDYMEPSNFEQLKTTTQLTGQPPKYYTIKGSEFQFFPVCDQAYDAELIYLLRFPALSSTNTSNWILEDYPDAYLYGAALHAAPWLKDDDRATLWGTLFQTAIDDICAADPMPPDMAALRTELPIIQWLGRRGRYDITSDSF